MLSAYLAEHDPNDWRDCLAEFLEPDLAPLGREIITCCMDDGTIEQYESLIPS